MTEAEVLIALRLLPKKECVAVIGDALLMRSDFEDIDLVSLEEILYKVRFG